MSKYRTVDEKRKIIIYLLQDQPVRKLRPFEHDDDWLLSHIDRLYAYEPLWTTIDAVIGKPITDKVRCQLWNRIAEALHYA